MKVSILIPMILLLSPSVLLGTGGSIVVPNDATNTEGNDVAFVPFVIADQFTERYQQIYHASQFSSIPTGGAFITRLFFRPDCVLNNGGAFMSNLQVNLSTTSKAPDQLSTGFADNVGRNDTIVFGPGSFTVGAGGGDCPAAFEDNLELNRPFFYNPTEGNLLMEVRIYPGHVLNNPGRFAHDGANVSGDSVSRAYAPSVDATVVTQSDTTGIITEFQFDVVPSLTNSLTTNAVVITWPVQPKNFVLQWAHELGSSSNWQLYTNQIGGGASYYVLSLPRNSLDRARFFRLACPSCPPIR
jgi:hypothetical protein